MTLSGVIFILQKFDCRKQHKSQGNTAHRLPFGLCTVSLWKKLFAAQCRRMEFQKVAGFYAAIMWLAKALCRSLRKTAFANADARGFR